MKLMESIKIHAVDGNKNQALCGQVKDQEVREGHYLEVSCKLCQWIMNNQLTDLNSGDKK